MKTSSIADRESRRRQILAAAQGLGWRFAAKRLRSARARTARLPAPKAAWLLATDGRPALSVARSTD